MEDLTNLNRRVGAKIVDLIPFCCGSLFLELIACSFSATVNVRASGDIVIVGAESPFAVASLGELVGVGVRRTKERKEWDVVEHAGTGEPRASTFPMSDYHHIARIHRCTHYYH
jgi:hypothetical protein